MVDTPNPPRLLAHFLDNAAGSLKQLGAAGLYRKLTPLESVTGPEVCIEGKRVINWCSNDYLGLSQHPQVIGAATQAMQEAGVGARASRLLSGDTRWHQALEQRLAAWFQTEAALVYSSGYQANYGALGALLSDQDIVFVDRLAHASLLDAARATRATFRVFKHNDAGHLEKLLSASMQARQRWVVTEGVFSMDGDRAPLAELLMACEKHGAILYLDDAHGAFVCGKTGRGSPELSGVDSRRLIYMATLGKALGCQGGFLAGPQVLIEHLINKSRTFIYSTGLAVPIAAAAAAALNVVEAEPHRRAYVEALSRRIHQALLGMKIKTAAGASHILPVIVGDAKKTVRVASHLWQQGLWAPAIRPPTVAEGAARLRLGVTALHTEAHAQGLIQALEDAFGRKPSLSRAKK